MTSLRRRRAGILLHPTSLPGGVLGSEAYGFVDFLTAAEQQLWQVLPLSPPAPDGSPYASRSAFAGSAALIDAGELTPLGLRDAGGADREARLRAGCTSWRAAPPPSWPAFAEAAREWLDDWALFEALHVREARRPWWEWPPPLRDREAGAMAEAQAELAEEVAFQRFLQWALFAQWDALKRYANERGVRVIGDIPIFVNLDSADVWGHRELFKLDAKGAPEVVAGVPPDLFSATGQRWGNPHYDWEAMHRDGYRWWKARAGWALRTADIVRLDHFRGFAAAWEIPAGAETAEEGEWVPGPGRAVFDAIAEGNGPLPLIAEDLGIITPDVVALRDDLGLPGMAILQYAFGGDAANPYLPHNLRQRSVVYTGTHDNDTTAGWLANARPEELEHLARYAGLAAPGADDLVRLGWESVADDAIIPMQDVLGLGNEARMNLPGSNGNNWAWRFSWDELAAGRGEWLRDLTRLSRRGREQ